MNDVLVSVVMITYNHEAYIKQAIQSILVQNCNFGVELIISNDKSTDETDAVIKSLINNSNIPQHINITYHNHQKNKGMMDNFIWTLNQASGKYIALCEGDDYWTDPLKLQKQVGFLEGNPEYVICGAIAQKLIVNNPEGMHENAILIKDKTKLKTKDFLSGYHMHTSTIMFIRQAMNLPSWFTKISNGDVVLLAILSQSGFAYFLNEVVSVYRITGTGVWSSSTLAKRYHTFKNTVNYLNRYFKGVYKRDILGWEYKEAKRLGQYYLDKKDYSLYTKHLFLNYHRYFWYVIWLPRQQYIVNGVKQNLIKKWYSFTKFIAFRTRYQKIKNVLFNENK